MTDVTECYLPQIAALSSMLASGLIIAEVLQDGQQRGAVSRVLLSMSAGDILFSLGWFLASWAQHLSWSCVFQGFIIQLGYMASLLSNASLAMVYLLMIQYNWPQGRIQTKIPRMMLYLWSFCLVTALVPLALDMYRFTSPVCWIGSPKSQDTTFIIASLQVIPIWSCIFLDSVTMLLIFRKARLLEAQVDNVDQYQESLDSHTRTTEDDSVQIDLLSLPDVNASLLRGSEGLGDRESHHGVFSFVEFMLFEPVPMVFPYQDEAGGYGMNIDGSMLISSAVSNTSRAHDPREDQVDPVEDYMIPQEEQVTGQPEEQNPETAITREPLQDGSVASNERANNNGYIEPLTNIGSNSTSERSADSTPNMPRSHKRSQLIAQQGMWYIAGFFMTYGFATISVLVFAIASKWNPPLDRTSYFFLAGQAVFNFLVFSRGRQQMKTRMGAKLKSWIWNGAAHCRTVFCLLKQRRCLPLSDELHQSAMDTTSTVTVLQHNNGIKHGPGNINEQQCQCNAEQQRTTTTTTQVFTNGPH
ncbi:expressed unknown protein [Seminavis robusta]|uniref:G-protein coupled receptors family 2 profile 2 domain-containing protein n=1 Tax=Seminavis robusta TaxID=568900 RepID=A0A9N8E562_9STRA|nr:expressed unknown protein [Seminavis robusta]|eukprot:Sro682_g186450.1 n/a (529) ;mRNA; f:7593-9264